MKTAHIAVSNTNIMPHARRMKRLFATNEQTIIKHLSINESFYRQYIFDCGMTFLEEFYDLNDPKQQQWIQRLATDQSLGFWAFWTGEWKIRENKFLRFNRRGFDYNDWITFHYLATVSEDMQVAFYNFIKHKNIKL